MEIGFVVPIVAVSKIIISMYVLNITFSYLPIVLAFSGSLSIYLFDRLNINREDKCSTNKSKRIEIIRKYKNSIEFAAYTSLIIFISILFIELSIVKFLICCNPILIFIFYSKLKNTLYLDTVSIAFAWSSELVLIPIFFSDFIYNNYISLIVFLCLFIMKFSETELSNIRDLSADSMAGNTTLPVKLGVEKVKKLIITGEVVSLLVLGIISNSSLFFLATLLSATYIFYIIYNLDEQNISNLMLKNRLVKIILSISIILIIL